MKSNRFFFFLLEDDGADAGAGAGAGVCRTAGGTRACPFVAAAGAGAGAALRPAEEGVAHATTRIMWSYP